MANAEITVDLRVSLEKLKADLASAKSAMTQAMGAGESMPHDTERVATSMQKVAKASTEAARAWKEQKAALESSMRIIDNTDQKQYGKAGPGANIGPVSIGGGLATKPSYMGPIPPIISTSPSAKSGGMPSDASQFIKNIMVSAMSGSGSLAGNVAAWRQSFTALSQTQTGRTAMGQFGLSGIAGAAAGATALQVAFVAMRATMSTLSHVMNETIASFERARQLYAKQLTSGGLPSAFIAQRSALASIIGVSENEVMQYGSAIKYLNGRLEFSSNIMSKTAPQLTAVSYEFGILKQNMNALFASIANELAPEIIKLIRLFSEAAQAAAEYGPKVARKLIEALANQSSYPMTQMAKLFFKLMPESKDKLEQPEASARRLETSPWEKMGLVLGNMGGQNYAAETAKNTRRLVALFESNNQNNGRNQNPIYNPLTAQP